MKTHPLFFVFALLILLIRPYPSQAQQVTFNRVLPPEGSYFGLVSATAQDLHGYIWLGVYDVGLSRYDGYHITTYANDPLNASSLASNEVQTICAARDGIIWIGTQDSGLDRFDPATNIFTHFHHDPKKPASLIDDRVTAILEDNEGTIWVGTMNGLDRMDQSHETFTHYQENENDVTSLSNNQVQVLYEDRHGTLWIGTGRKHWSNTTSPDKGGLNRFDRNAGKFTRYLHKPKDSLSLLNNRIGAIFEDTKGTFWICTAGDGLHTMDRDKGIFKRYNYDPSHPEKLSLPPRKKEVTLDLDLFFICEDCTGAVWFGTSGGWLTRYDPETKKVMHYESFNDDVQDMQALSGAFTSKEGVLWFRTWLGNIYRVNPSQSIFSHFSVGSIVSVIHQDASGVLWIGTLQEGLIRVNRNTGSIRKFFSEPPGSFTMNDVHINAIYQEDDSTLWIGSEKALYHYNMNTQIFTSYKNDPGNETSLTKGIVEYIIPDCPGSLWIATQAGLDRFDIKSGIFTHFRHSSKDSNSISDDIIMCLLKDHSGNVWAGTYPGVVNLFNPRTGKFRHFPLGGSIGNIIEDSENRIWVGTSIGLYRSNIARDSFTRFTDQRIPIKTTTVVTAIIEDHKKNLWISSSAGIFRINLKRNEISAYNRNQGVEASNFLFFSMSDTKKSGDELFFGDKTGFYSFFPNQFKSNTTPPQIVISDFRLADKTVKPGKSGPLSVPVTQTKEIILNYNQNVFSFDFVAMHYSNPEDNQHFYMLENLDNTWRKAGTEKTAYYYNVPPGRYIFRVKAANSDGVWAEKAIAVIVNPPWWRTWWAYTLFSTIFLIALWSFIKWRERVLNKEKILLEEKVAIRTQELQNEKEKVETTLTELKTTQEQLIQSEKMAALGKLHQAMLNERLRISRELHDDIGSTLSGIVLYSHLAEDQVLHQQTKEVERSLDIIQQSANDMMNRLKDIVWAVNPEHNSLKNLVQRLEEYAMEIATAKNIKVSVNIPGCLDELRLPMESCHNIYLLGKEAINNAVKYSDACLLELNVNHSGRVIEFTIKDNGKGFDITTVKKGNGLVNMRKRANEASAILSVRSVPGEGTTISLQCEITQ